MILHIYLMGVLLVCRYATIYANWSPRNADQRLQHLLFREQIGMVLLLNEMNILYFT